VQSAQAAASYESWKQGTIVELPTTTEAEGLATTTGYELTQSIIHENLRDFILVDDAEMRAAVGHYLALCHCIAEISGAAALAGALKWREQVAGKKVGVILSGANLTLPQMQRILAERDG
jgi:threonine dehydratase